jgi:small subunit ribosomal protein S1
LEVNRKKKQIKLSLKALQAAPVKEEAPVQLFDPGEPSKGGNTEQRRNKKGPKSGRRRSDDSYEGSYMDYLESSAEPEPTTMEILLREAMEKAKVKKATGSEKAKGKKKYSPEHEEIFARTLDTTPRN